MIEEKETCVSVKTENKDSQKYIAYYYFNFSAVKDYNKECIFYPFYGNAITDYKNKKISFLGNSFNIILDKSVDFEIIYTEIHLESRIGRIETVFNNKCYSINKKNYDNVFVH